MLKIKQEGVSFVIVWFVGGEKISTFESDILIQKIKKKRRRKAIIKLIKQKMKTTSYQDS